MKITSTKQITTEASSNDLIEAVCIKLNDLVSRESSPFFNCNKDISKTIYFSGCCSGKFINLIAVVALILNAIAARRVENCYAAFGADHRGEFRDLSPTACRDLLYQLNKFDKAEDIKIELD